MITDGMGGGGGGDNDSSARLLKPRYMESYEHLRSASEFTSTTWQPFALHSETGGEPVHSYHVTQHTCMCCVRVGDSGECV